MKRLVSVIGKIKTINLTIYMSNCTPVFREGVTGIICSY
jgi:hypothetical protein